MDRSGLAGSDARARSALIAAETPTDWPDQNGIKRPPHIGWYV
jgi:hypothetical protein